MTKHTSFWYNGIEYQPMLEGQLIHTREKKYVEPGTVRAVWTEWAPVKMEILVAEKCYRAWIPFGKRVVWWRRTDLAGFADHIGIFRFKASDN